MYVQQQQQQPVSALQQQAIIRSSYTGLDETEGQDLLFHLILYMKT
jgi:hypothetical protein